MTTQEDDRDGEGKDENAEVDRLVDVARRDRSRDEYGDGAQRDSGNQRGDGAVLRHRQLHQLPAEAGARGGSPPQLSGPSPASPTPIKQVVSMRRASITALGGMRE